MSNEVKTVGSLSLLYAFRMIGLFMVLPILMVYGNQYTGSTPALLGLALGVYGLTQALFQIPLGLLSDVIGRKPVIVGGLVLFAVGSVVAATANSIEGLILGRALQGTGAIASAIMAMVADLTAEENRTKAMAAIGASIGLSFSAAMILGPILASVAGIAGVFYLASALAIIGILIVTFVVPTPHQVTKHREAGAIPQLMFQTLKNTQLLRLDWGIFSLHCILMTSFVAIPTVLAGSLGIPKSSHWLVYLPVLVLAFIVMLPFIIIAEKKRKMKPVFIGAIVLMGISCAVMSLSLTLLPSFIGLIFLFFVAFNLLEATLPSLVSKLAPAGSKGTAMGVYSTSQFFGAFCGGSLGGWVLQNYGASTVFIFSAAMAFLWMIVAISMKPPKHLSSLCFSVGGDYPFEQDIKALAGVEDCLYDRQEGLLYLKVDKAVLNEDAMKALTHISDDSENTEAAQDLSAFSSEKSHVA